MKVPDILSDEPLHVRFRRSFCRFSKLIHLDRFSAEIFINDGEQVMSAVILTEQNAKGISFFVDGAAKIDVVKYDLV